MRVRVLGGFSVDGFTDRDVGSRKARTLLKILALTRGSSVPVERLVDDLGVSPTPETEAVHDATVLDDAPRGPQVPEATWRALLGEAGFTRFRRATETPFNRVFEARR